ncbi:MAG: PIN domain-containing protein [Hyphomonadaceae bacterium]|nr:PIN domain-containing protein [Hyphomonadaceae bacterium]
MTLFLLDTNVLVDVLRDPSGIVANQLAAHMATGDTIATSSIVQYELELGALRSARPALGLERIAGLLADGISVLAFNGSSGQDAARLAAGLSARGEGLQACDALIAGHARSLAATLVTADARLEQALSDHPVVNWREAAGTIAL